MAIFLFKWFRMSGSPPFVVCTLAHHLRQDSFPGPSIKIVVRCKLHIASNGSPFQKQNQLHGPPRFFWIYFIGRGWTGNAFPHISRLVLSAVTSIPPFPLALMLRPGVYASKCSYRQTCVLRSWVLTCLPTHVLPFPCPKFLNCSLVCARQFAPGFVWCMVMRSAL